VAIRAFRPRIEGRSVRVALIGAGVQAHSHLPVIGHLLPGAELTLFGGRDPARLSAEAEAAARLGIGPVGTAASAQAAVADADVVITTASFGPVRQVMPPEWLAPDALVVPVDYATYVSAAVARAAALFVVDERGQFEANRAAGLFDDYPDPATTLGEVLRDGRSRPPGRVLVTHLGVGVADLVFADAILAGAATAGLGTLLPR
jgi:ornithine cyclodeaminase/alanine dehydrogenase-like protein (mu-crystallin family)